MAAAIWIALVGVTSTLLSLAHANVRHLYVDSTNGNDSLCTPYSNDWLPSSNVSCRTIQYALHVDAGYEDCMQSSPLQDVTVHLADGIHSIHKELCIFSSINVSLVAEHTGEASVHCATFSNYGYDPTNNRTYDNLYVNSSNGVTFRGLNFEHCGASSSNVFITHSSNILFDNCVFRGNIGPPLQVRFTSSLTLLNTQFINNHDLSPATYDDSEVTFKSLYSTVITSGGLTFFTNTTPTNILISNCTFSYNEAGSNLPNSTRPVIFKSKGHGGGVIIKLVATRNCTIVIENNVFSSNGAELDGGAIYISLSDNASANTIVMSNNIFVNNTVQSASGGAVSVSSYFISYNNSIMVNSCTFTNNSGNSGGAFSVALYDSNYNSAQYPDTVTFYDCKFIGNSAFREGTAVGLFSVIRVDQIGFPVYFVDCIFDSNLSLEDLRDTSALTAFRFPVYLSGKNIFVRNVGGGINLISTLLQAEGDLQFINNTAKFGGGIAMYDLCRLVVTPNTVINLEGNYVAESGAAIYVEVPPIHSIINITNRACFMQYNCLCNDSLQDFTPQEWKNVSINFIRNRALLSGAAIYASDMRFCTWLSNYSSTNLLLNNSTIFKLPQELSKLNPFYFESNDVLAKVENASFMDTDLGTDPLLIIASVDGEESDVIVQPGEIVSIDLYAIDQFGNYQEAVWSVEAPGLQAANLDAFSANGGTYLYTVPPFSMLPLADSHVGTFTLNFTLLRTLGLMSNITFSVNNCHPGYVKKNDVCVCETSNPDIAHCDNENRYVYLREGLLGSLSDVDRSLTTARVFQGYVNCSRLGKLPGCRFDFDQPEGRCQAGRNGSLCKTCASGYAITMDLQHCLEVEFCAAGDTILVLLCIFVVFISFFILLFNVELPNEMKGFVFYVQVIGLVYRPYSIAQSTYDKIQDIGVFLNLLGFSLPIPLCLSPSIKAYYVALFGYISPLLVMISIATYVLAARCIKFFSDRSALKGITFLSLFVYKYIADASFLLISCQNTQYGFVFQYDGTQRCDDIPFVIFFIIGLLLVLFFVVPVPFIISYIIVKRPIHFYQYVDVLTEGLCTKCRWWGGWDIGRRLPFVFVAYLVVFETPTLVLTLMSFLALAVLIVHLFTKPYKKWQINLIEALILLNLVMVTIVYLDPFTSPVPMGLKTFLSVLPYAYPVVYTMWRIGSRFSKKYHHGDKNTSNDTSTLLLPVEGKQDDASKKRTDLLTATSQTSSSSDTPSSSLSSSLRVTADSISSLREPLLDS